MTTNHALRPFSIGLGAVLAVIVAAGGLAGCGGGDEHAGGGKPTGATCPTTQTLTYAGFAEGFFNSYCIRCHSANVSGSARMSAPTSVNFDTVTGIRFHGDHIDEHAGAGPSAVNTSMPPSGPFPTEQERRNLSEWLACDAP